MNKALKALDEYTAQTGLSSLNPEKQKQVVEAFYAALPTIRAALHAQGGEWLPEDISEACLSLSDEEVMASNTLAGEIAFEWRNDKSAGQALIALAKIGLYYRIAEIQKRRNQPEGN